MLFKSSVVVLLLLGHSLIAQAALHSVARLNVERCFFLDSKSAMPLPNIPSKICVQSIELLENVAFVSDLRATLEVNGQTMALDHTALPTQYDSKKNRFIFLWMNDQQGFDCQKESTVCGTSDGNAFECEKQVCAKFKTQQVYVSFEIQTKSELDHRPVVNPKIRVRLADEALGTQSWVDYKEAEQSTCRKIDNNDEVIYVQSQAVDGSRLSLDFCNEDWSCADRIKKTAVVKSLDKQKLQLLYSIEGDDRELHIAPLSKSKKFEIFRNGQSIASYDCTLE